jgi:hypothetical protein
MQPGMTVPGMSAMVTPSMAMGSPMGIAPMGMNSAVMAGANGFYGAMPQSAAASQALLGATVGNPPSTIGSVLKNALVFGALGAGIGAAASFILPGGPFIGAIVGGLAGAALGVIRGFRSAKRAQEEFRIMTQNMQAQAPAPEVPVHVANVNKPKKTKKPKRTGKVGKKPADAAHKTDAHKVDTHKVDHKAGVHAAHKTAKKATKSSLAVNVI